MSRHYKPGSVELKIGGATFDQVKTIEADPSSPEAKAFLARTCPGPTTITIAGLIDGDVVRALGQRMVTILRRRMKRIRRSNRRHFALRNGEPWGRLAHLLRAVRAMDEMHFARECADCFGYGFETFGRPNTSVCIDEGDCLTCGGDGWVFVPVKRGRGGRR